MFIKYGEEKYLKLLKEKGEIYFNNAQYFRDYERNSGNKGLGDIDDSGVFVNCPKIEILGKKNKTILNDRNVCIIPDECNKMPIFCIAKVEDEMISEKEYTDFVNQFTSYNYALIIKDEEAFLENIRYCFRSRAFAHEVFYQDEMQVEFIDFIKNGNSDIDFYKKDSVNSYYMKLTEIYGNDEIVTYVDESNCHRTMYKKHKYFENQQEYRIILPYEAIDKGKCYKINPVESELIKITDLVKK